jgi:hypothetical protein
MNISISEIVFVALGIMVSVVAFFLKRESMKVDRIQKRLNSIEIELAKNSAVDTERWNQTSKLLEDRRIDIHQIFDQINKK